jgi:SNF2 family DNA or RNA helicase
MKLFKHQEDAIELAKQHGSYAFFHDCGCGKTCTAINVIKHWRKSGAGPALVVCPLSIIDAAWLEDCRKFAPELSAVSLWSKKPADRKKRLAEQHDIYIANFETFKLLYPEIVTKKFGVLIVDESSKMKQHDSQTTRALLAMAGLSTRGKGGLKFVSNHVVPYRYVLSGTPAPNDETEYWSQIKFVAGPGNKVFSDNYFSFRGYFCYSIPISPVCKKWKFKKSMRGELMETMKCIAHVVRKEDAVDLPEQTHVIRKVFLGDNEQKAYNTFKNELVLRYADQEILATSAIVEIMKLRQLTSGFAYTDTGIIQTGESKLEELKSLLEEIGDNQVLIWANFKHEIAMLLKELPSSDAIWSGTPDRDAVIANFKSGGCKYLIANPQSAAHGLTFTNAKYAVYFSLNYSYELHEQSINRLHRIGQRHPCTYYYLIADNTVDELIYKTVLGKKVISDEVLNYLRSGNHGRVPVAAY